MNPTGESREITGKDMEFHISCTAKVRRKAPVPSPTVLSGHLTG